MERKRFALCLESTLKQLFDQKKSHLFFFHRLMDLSLQLYLPFQKQINSSPFVPTKWHLFSSCLPLIFCSLLSSFHVFLFLFFTQFIYSHVLLLCFSTFFPHSSTYILSFYSPLLPSPAHRGPFITCTHYPPSY